MTDPRRLAALARLAAVKKESDLAALARADASVRATLAEVGQLDAALAEARRTAAGTADPATHATLEGFARWSAAQRTLLADRLEASGRQAAVARDRARTSFGRSDVPARLAEAARTRRRPGM